MGRAASLLKSTVLLVLVGTGFIWAQQCDSGIVFSGPIQINKGGTYTGNWQSTDPSVPAVMVSTTEPVTIVNSRLRGPGDLLHYYLSPTAVGITSATSLTVQQSCFVGTNSNVKGAHKGTPLWVQNAVSVRVENCDFESGGFYGIWVEGYIGDHTVNNTVLIRNNRIHNVDGRPSDGNGGYLATQDTQGTHGIILSEIHGVPGIEIAWNQIINDPYQSGVGDSINIYNSPGTAASPMQIHDNYVQGGYEADPTTANTFNYGGAGLTTDGDFQTDLEVATGFIKIHDNQFVSQARGGLNIALGHDMEIYSNRVVSHGQLSDGTNYSLANGSGINQANYVNDPPGAFGNNSFHDNLSGMRKLYNGSPSRLDYYWSVLPSVEVNDASWTLTSDAPTLADEANELLLWNEKLIANGITVGSDAGAPTLSGSVKIISGNNQVGAPNGNLAAPLVAQVLSSTGAPVPGVNVSFMVATGNATARQHFGITDANGLATTDLVLGTAPTAVQVNVIAVGYAGASFSTWITQPPSTITEGGIAGVGGSVPPVPSISPNALISIYGQNFLPPGIPGRRVLPSEFVDGGLPTALLGACVEIGGKRAAILDVFPNQINAQVPEVTGSSTNVRVLTNCGTPAEASSNQQTKAVSTASPEFLYFQLNADGRNPIVVVNASTGVSVGPSDILGGALTPARAGDVLTAYASGFGLLSPALATGQIPTGAANTVGPVSVTIGGLALAKSDILYAGAAPGQIIDQLNFRVPANVAVGNQPIVISIAGVSSPPNAFIAIQQ